MFRFGVLLTFVVVGCGDNLHFSPPIDAAPVVIDAPPLPVDAPPLVDAPPPPVSSVRVGNDGSFESFDAVAVGADGRVFAAGFAQGGAGAVDGFVARFDAADQFGGARALGTAQSDNFLGAATDGAGGVVLVGASGSAQALGVAVHVGGDLSVTAARSFGGSMRGGNVTTPGGQVLNAIAPVSRGFIAAGDTFPGTAITSGTSWILALDDQLAPRWELAIHDGVDRSGAAAVAPDGDRTLIGGYAHVSATTSGFRTTAFADGASPTTAWVRQQQVMLPGAEHEGVTAIAALPGGGAWLAGYTDYGGGFLGQIVKLDADGGVVGQLRLESAGNPILRAVIATADGGCIVAGDASNHGLLVKLDANLGVTWQQSVGIDAISRIMAAAPAPDGSIVFVGVYGNDGWLLRLRDVTAAPVGFGGAATTVPVPENAASSNSATMNTPVWASTSAVWAPTMTDLSTLTVRPAT